MIIIWERVNFRSVRFFKSKGGIVSKAFLDTLDLSGLKWNLIVRYFPQSFVKAQRNPMKVVKFWNPSLSKFILQFYPNIWNDSSKDLFSERKCLETYLESFIDIYMKSFWKIFIILWNWSFFISYLWIFLCNFVKIAIEILWKF